jgi:hypothetical protein
MRISKTTAHATRIAVTVAGLIVSFAASAGPGRDRPSRSPMPDVVHFDATDPYSPPGVCETGTEGFQPDEKLLAEPGYAMIDPEFDQLHGRVTWQAGRDPVDATASAYVMDLDRVTGDFLWETLVEVDQGLDALSHVGTGPEWIYHNWQSSIVYHKRIGNQLHLAHAQETGDGWAAELLESGVDRYPPMGSQDPCDPIPWILYNYETNGERLIASRRLDDPMTERCVTDVTARGARYVKGPPDATEPWADRFFITTVIVDGVRQAARADRVINEFGEETIELTQLTFDEGDKRDGAFMWWAPEFETYVLMVNVANEAIGLYRQEGDEMVRYYTIDNLPQRYLFSAEPFTYQTLHGEWRSYISMSTADQVSGGGQCQSECQPLGPGDVVLVGINPKRPFCRVVSDSTPAQRIDPEVYVAESGPIVYYNRVDIVDGVPLTYPSAPYRAVSGLSP